jgi:hypothetical protein
MKRIVILFTLLPFTAGLQAEDVRITIENDSRSNLEIKRAGAPTSLTTVARRTTEVLTVNREDQLQLNTTAATHRPIFYTPADPGAMPKRTDTLNIEEIITNAPGSITVDPDLIKHIKARFDGLTVWITQVEEAHDVAQTNDDALPAPNILQPTAEIEDIPGN